MTTITPDQLIEYERDIREAQIAFPNEPTMRAAYERFMKEIRKTDPWPRLRTGKALDIARAAVKATLRKPCGVGDCDGSMELQGVCSNCLAGQKGYKTQWQCAECLRIEYSKKPFTTWYEELTKESE